MAALADPPSPPAAPAKRRWRLWLSLVAVLLLLAGAGLFGMRTYARVREDRIVQKAREFMEKKDFGQAMIAAQRAVQMNPRSVAANKIMAEMADMAGASQAMYWHRAVAYLEPGVMEHRFHWAQAALEHGNLPMAQQALSGVPAEKQASGIFHDLAARVAQSLGKPPDAVSHFGEALRLEPENARFRFGLATAQIDLDDPDVQARAVQVIEEFRSQPEYRRRAYRALIQNHFRHERWKEGFLLAADLQAVPGAPFEDRMLLLDLLRKFNRPEFHAYLMDVQTAASRDPEHTAALIAWLNRNTMALIATDWGKSLPEEIRARNPVPSALAESYANLHNWPRLKTLVESGNWEQSDFMRSALYSRALREEGDLLVAKTQWMAAVNAARGRPDALAQLARFADACRWDAEAVDLLWQVARGKTDQRWALSELERKFGERRNARGLLNVATQRLELNPKDTAAQNNVAALSFLLNTNLDRAQILAREAYQAQPGNPATVATRAYALHLLGKTEEGLGLMRTLGEAQLQSPALAATYGILLVESPDSAEAVRFLEIAQGANLLPEEAALVADARSRLSRKASDKR